MELARQSVCFVEHVFGHLRSIARVDREAVSSGDMSSDRLLLKELRRALSKQQVHVSASEQSLYGRDASNIEGRASLVCFPESTSDVQAIIEVCRRLERPFVARGAGTGLAGGAVPGNGEVVVSMMRMNRIESIDPVNQLAWVQPGVLNLDLTRAASSFGLQFAPDPSSQQSCSVGGNVANNSGGPHCLADGVTTNHVIGLEVVLTDGSIIVLNGDRAEASGVDLRGCFVGSEGMFGIATRICVRLLQNPPCVTTLLLDFESVRDGTDTVGAIIAAGIIPAAMEMMDRLCLRAVEDFVHADLPVESAAALLIELAGLQHEVEHDCEVVSAVASAHGVKNVRLARDEAERELLWKARKNAFGAIARIQPNYYLHDTVVPRSRLSDVLDHVYRIARENDLQVVNVFHAGDGNLHPLLIFDKREPGVMDRVHRAGSEIVHASIEAGGVLSGEHGIGLEKREFMPLMFSPVDLAAQDDVRRAFDPLGIANPHKVIPSPSGCGDPVHIGDGAWI